MPSSRVLPQLVKAVAVSKPRRDTWLVEELLDAFIVWDEGVRVERTRFPGVLLVISEKLDPQSIVRLASRLEFSFMSRLVPATIAVEVENLNQLLEKLVEVIGGSGVHEFKLQAVVRGDGKTVVSESQLRAALEKMNFRVAGNARKVLAVESIDRLFVATLGEVRKCGYNCKLIA